MSTAMPTHETLVAQLRELNERSRTYGRQFWQVPFAYLAGAGIAAVQVSDGKHGPLALPLALVITGIVGAFVVWHLGALCCAARRSYEGISSIEGQLSLLPGHTQWSPGHVC
jgi:hypothetical protein